MRFNPITKRTSLARSFERRPRARSANKSLCKKLFEYRAATFPRPVAHVFWSSCISSWIMLQCPRKCPQIGPVEEAQGRRIYNADLFSKIPVCACALNKQGNLPFLSYSLFYRRDSHYAHVRLHRSRGRFDGAMVLRKDTNASFEKTISRLLCNVNQNS